MALRNVFGDLSLEATQQQIADAVTSPLKLLGGDGVSIASTGNPYPVMVGNFPTTQAVSGSVVVSQATAANLNATVTGSVNVFNSLIPAQFNSIDITYNLAGQIETVVYKQGATTVGTLTLSYTGLNLTRIVRT
jgi:hypothetical protein